MKINASVGRAPKTACVSKNCKTLKLEGESDVETAWLAELLAALRDGTGIFIGDKKEGFATGMEG